MVSSSQTKHSYELNEVIFELLASDSSVDAFACFDFQFGMPLKGFCITFTLTLTIILHSHKPSHRKYLTVTFANVHLNLSENCCTSLQNSYLILPQPEFIHSSLII